MASGGARAGAGRPKGSPNKVTAAKEAKIAASGLTPLEYMLSILRDADKPDAERFAAAKEAAPYCHAKLSSVDANLTADVVGEIVFKGLNG